MNSETIGILIGIGSSLIILAVYYLVRANKWKNYTENTTGHGLYSFLFEKFVDI